MGNIGRPSTIRPALKKIDSNPRRALASLYSTRTLSEVGVKLGVTSGTVRNEMMRLGIRIRAQKTPAPAGRVELALSKRGLLRNETARKVFIRLYKTEGLTLRKIADQLGVTSEGLRAFAIRSHVQLRRRGIRTGTKTRRSRIFDLTGCL